VLALIALIAAFFAHWIPAEQPGAAKAAEAVPEPFGSS
jgi:hypothetical protein